MPIENPSVREYLLKRKAEREALEQENSGYDTAGAVAGGLASLAAAFQGGNSIQTANQVMDQRESSRAKKMTDFDSGTDRYLKDVGSMNEADKLEREKQLLAREDDPTSEETKMANELAARMGYKGNPITASQFKRFSPVMEKLYDIEQKKLDRQEARDERRYQAGIKQDEKREGRLTTFGEARTDDDAKKIKDAAGEKQKFDSALKEMISLRKKHGGGAILNRDDVARGKQLSRDLLLAKKNMESLGVLSKSDEAIVNAIIPADPLEYNSPLAAIQGQDPILSNMEKFQQDSEENFKANLAQRLRGQPKTVVKTQTNKKTGEKRVVYSDGTSEIINATAGR